VYIITEAMKVDHPQECKQAGTGKVVTQMHTLKSSWWSWDDPLRTLDEVTVEHGVGEETQKKIPTGIILKIKYLSCRIKYPPFS